MKPKNMTAGTLFYESQSGINIEAVCITAPVAEPGYNNRAHWTWSARNTQTGEMISYGLTEGLEHYGPRLYEGPQYGGMQNGRFVLPLMGGDPLDPDAADPLGLRNPQHLAAWARSLGTDGPAIPVNEWIRYALTLSGKTEPDSGFTAFLEERGSEITKGIGWAFEKRVEPSFSHAFDLTAEVISKDPDAGDVTADMIRSAMMARISAMSDEDLLQAAGRFDTVEAEAEDGREPEM